MRGVEERRSAMAATCSLNEHACEGGDGELLGDEKRVGAGAARVLLRQHAVASGKIV